MRGARALRVALPAIVIAVALQLAGAQSYRDQWMCDSEGFRGGRSYTFTVEALGADGNAVRALESSRYDHPDVPPSVPVAVTAEAVNLTAVRVRWGAPPDNGGTPVTGYAVHRNGTQVARLGADARSHVDEGRVPHVSLAYTVRAANAAGEGPESNPPSVAAPDVAPEAPATVTAIATGVTDANVSWSAPPPNGGTPPTGYIVELNGAARASVPPTPLSFRDAGLLGGRTYSYAVRAVNAAGPGPARSAANVTTLDVAPGQVTAVSASAFNATTALLTWSPPAANLGTGPSAYLVYRDGAHVGNTSATSFFVYGLTVAQTYAYTIVALNGAGAGPASAPYQLYQNVPPGAPTITRVEQQDRPSTNTRWYYVYFTVAPPNGGTGITGYQSSEYIVYHGGWQNPGGQAGSPYTLFYGIWSSDKMPSWFRVRSCNAAGCGAWSNEVHISSVVVLPSV